MLKAKEACKLKRQLKRHKKPRCPKMALKRAKKVDKIAMCWTIGHLSSNNNQKYIQKEKESKKITQYLKIGWIISFSNQERPKSSQVK
jgi:hypothetical protein